MDKLVVISGHSAGLGRALTQHYLAAGWQVLGLARRQLMPTPRLVQTALDLGDSAALVAWLDGDVWRKALANAEEVVLINNAGTVAPNALAGRQDAATIAAAVALNITAPMLLSNALLRDVAASCLKTIVHISSGAGRKACVGWSVYGACKAALDQHAAVLAAENHPNLRVLSIAPGVVDTDMQAAIRAAAIIDFPLRPRFDDLHQYGKLQTAKATAARLASMIEAASPDDAVCHDVRE